MGDALGLTDIRSAGVRGSAPRPAASPQGIFEPEKSGAGQGPLEFPCVVVIWPETCGWVRPF